MEAQVIHHLKQAMDLKPFLNQEGPRKGKMILNMPFWIKLKDGWWFDFIRKDMDRDMFINNLKTGTVYYLDKITSK